VGVDGDDVGGGGGGGGGDAAGSTAVAADGDDVRGGGGGGGGAAGGAAVAADGDDGDDSDDPAPCTECELCTNCGSATFDSNAIAATALCFDHWMKPHTQCWLSKPALLARHITDEEMRTFTRCRSMRDFHRIVYDTLRSASINGDMPQQRSTTATTPCVSVFAVLLRLTSSLQYDFIAAMLGIARATVQHIIHRWRPLVARACLQYFELSVDAALRNSHVQIVRDLGPNVCMVVDCTYCTTHQAYACAVRRTQHCPNKKCTVHKVMLFCYPNGVPALHVTPLPGGGDDALMFNKLLETHEPLRAFVKELREYLERQYPDSGLMPAFLVDRGFAHIKLAADSCKRLDYDADNECACHLASPTFLQCGTDGKFSCVDEVCSNRKLAVHRSVVEQANARVRTFHLLYHPLHLFEAPHLSNWLDIACGIMATNYKPFRHTASREDIEAAGAMFVASLLERTAADAQRDATTCSPGIAATIALGDDNTMLFSRDAGNIACWQDITDAVVGTSGPLFQRTLNNEPKLVPSYSDTLTLDMPSHRYTLNGALVASSVTGCLAEFFVFDEKTMAACCAKSSIDVYRGLTKAAVLKRWEQWRCRGTRVHLALERHVNASVTSALGLPAGDMLLCDDAERAAFDHGKAYLQQLVGGGWTVAFAELLVCAEKWDLAGAIDVVLYKCNDDDDRYELLTVDWKVPGRRDVVQQLAQAAQAAQEGGGGAGSRVHVARGVFMHVANTRDNKNRAQQLLYGRLLQASLNTNVTIEHRIVYLPTSASMQSYVDTFTSIADPEPSGTVDSTSAVLRKLCGAVDNVLDKRAQQRLANINNRNALVQFFKQHEREPPWLLYQRTGAMRRMAAKAVEAGKTETAAAAPAVAFAEAYAQATTVMRNQSLARGVPVALSRELLEKSNFWTEWATLGEDEAGWLPPIAEELLHEVFPTPKAQAGAGKRSATLARAHMLVDGVANSVTSRIAYVANAEQQTVIVSTAVSASHRTEAYRAYIKFELRNGDKDDGGGGGHGDDDAGDEDNDDDDDDASSARPPRRKRMRRHTSVSDDAASTAAAAPSSSPWPQQQQPHVPPLVDMSASCGCANQVAGDCSHVLALLLMLKRKQSGETACVRLSDAVAASWDARALVGATAKMAKTARRAVRVQAPKRRRKVN